MGVTVFDQSGIAAVAIDGLELIVPLAPAGAAVIIEAFKGSAARAIPAADFVPIRVFTGNLIARAGRMRAAVKEEGAE